LAIVIAMDIRRTFAGLCCVYDDPTWLAQMIESVYENVGAIFFLIGDRPWNGAPSDNTRTVQIIRSFPDPERKLKLVTGSWTNETDQRNAGLALIAEAGYPFCFIVDADELYDPVELTRMQTVASTRPDIGCWYMSWWTYWKSERFRIDPPEGYTPSVFVRCQLGTFRENRHVAAALHAQLPPQVGMCHHMSYARSNEEILRKITTFSHSHEIRPGWYEEVWLAWDKNPQMQNIHPCYPDAYRRAVPQPVERLPPVLRKGR
jgi:glycosyltransferase involved in cell wall biosynthesis